MARKRIRKNYTHPRPSPEQADKLSEELYAFREARSLTIKELANSEGFPCGHATVGRIERCEEYTLATYNAVKAWLEAQPKPEPKAEPIISHSAAETSDADNLGVLLAKISVMAEQLNAILAIQQEDHEQLMQMTPYIQNWSAIRKRLQLWKVEKGGLN